MTQSDEGPDAKALVELRAGESIAANGDVGIERFLVQVWGAADDRLTNNPQVDKSCSEVMSFSDATGRPVQNLLGIKAQLFGIVRNSKGEIEIYNFANGDAAARRLPQEKVVLTYNQKNGIATESMTVFDGESNRKLTVETSKHQDNGRFTIEASSHDERQIIEFENGRFTKLAVQSADGKQMDFVFDERDGSITGLRIKSESMKEEASSNDDNDFSKEAIETARQTLIRVAEENGLTPPDALFESKPTSFVSADVPPAAVPGNELDKASPGTTPEDDNSFRKDYNKATVEALKLTLGKAVEGADPFDALAFFSDRVERMDADPSDLRNAKLIREFMRADTPADRQKALDELSKEALRGDNHYALNVLRRLTLIHATCGVQEAKTSAERTEALKLLASVELGECEGRGRKAFIDGLPDTMKEFRKNEKDLPAKDRNNRLETRLALSSCVDAATAVDTTICDFVKSESGNRKTTLQQLEQKAAKLCTVSDDIVARQTIKEIHQARFFDVALDVAETKDAKAALKALEKIEAQEVDGNQFAVEFLKRIPQGDLERLKEELASANTDVSSKALLELQEKLKPQTVLFAELKQKSPSELLAQFAERPSDITSARLNAQITLSKAEQRVEGIVSGYLDRNATPVERQKAIEDLKAESATRVKLYASDNVEPLVGILNELETGRELDSASKLALRIADGPKEPFEAALKDTKTELRRLIDEAKKRGDGSLLNKEFKDLEKLLIDLDDPTKATDALQVLVNLVPPIGEQLDKLRVGAICNCLSRQPAVEDYHKVEAALKQEAEKYGNQFAKHLLPWVEASTVLKQIETTGTVEGTQSGIRDLAKLATKGNPYAAKSLASLLLADADSTAKYDFRNAVEMTNSGDAGSLSLPVPDLGKLAAQSPEAYMKVTADLIETITKLPPADREDVKAAEAAALAITVLRMQERSAGAPVDASTSQLLATANDALKKNVSSSPYAFGALCSLINTTDIKSREALIDAVVAGARNHTVDWFLTRLENNSRLGDIVSMQILARVAGGQTGDRLKTAMASTVLEKVAGQDRETNQRILDVLMQTVKHHKDEGLLLATIGAVATRRGAITAEVRAVLHNGLADKSTNNSAALGMGKFANAWNDADVTALKHNLSDGVAGVFAANRDRISDVHQAAFDIKAFEILTSQPKDKTGTDAGERMMALKVLSTFSKNILPDHIPYLAALGNRVSVAESGDARSSMLYAASQIGKDGLAQKGFAPEQIEKLQIEAGKVLVAIILTSTNVDAKDLAARAIASHHFGGFFENLDLRDKIIDYSKGKKLSLDDVDRITSVLYGVPRPLALLMRELRPGFTDAEYYERAEAASKKYNVPKMVTNMQLWNSLPPAVRKELVERVKDASPDLIDPAQFEGVLVFGSLEEKFPFLKDSFYYNNAWGREPGSGLTRALEAINGENQKQAARQEHHISDLRKRYDQTLDELCAMTKDGKTGAFFSLEELPTHAKMIYGLVGPAASVRSIFDGNFDPTDLLPGVKTGRTFADFRSRWDDRQRELFKNLHSIEAEIAAGEKDLVILTRKIDGTALALGIGNFHAARNKGDTREADLAALKLIERFGADRVRLFGPEVYHSLFGDNRVGFERMLLNGMVSSGKFRVYSNDLNKRLDEGLGELREWTAGSKVEANAHRKCALEAIDCDPGINDIADIARSVNSDLKNFYMLFDAGMEGSKGPQFVEDMRRNAANLAKIFADATPEKIANCRASLAKLESALPSITDPDAHAAVKAKMDALKGFIEIADPASPPGKQLRSVLAEVQDPAKFNEDTLGKWFRENGPTILAGAVAAAITVVMLGTGTPIVVMILATSGAMVGGTQAMKEVLFQMDNKVLGLELGKVGERSLPLKWAADNRYKLLLFIAENFIAEMTGVTHMSPQQMDDLRGELIKTFANDVFYPLGEEFLMNTAVGFACLGAGQVGSNGFKSLFSKSTLNSLFRSPVTKDFAVAMKAANEAAAKSPYSRAIVEGMLKGIPRETANGLVFVTKAEVAGGAADQIAHKWVGRNNQYLALAATVAVAFAGGRAHRPPIRPGRGNEVLVEPNAVKEVLLALQRDGHTVRPVPGRANEWEVTTYNNRGDTPPLKLRLPSDVFGKLPHEMPVQGRPGVNPEALGKDGAWMSGSAKAMSAGDYAKAYEVARNAETKPPELQVKGEAREITAADITSGKIVDHINTMRDTGRVNVNGDGRLQIIESRTMVKLPDGAIVDLLNPSVTAGPGGKLLTPAQKAAMDKVLESPFSKRILAEHAFIMMEEMFHVRQISEGGAVLSSLYKGFTGNRPSETAARNDALDICGRNRDSYEREFLIAAYEAGIHPAVLKAHFAEMYVARAEVMDFVNKVSKGETPVPQRVDSVNPPNQPVKAVEPLDSFKPGAPKEVTPQTVPMTDSNPGIKPELRRVQDQPKSDPDPWTTKPLNKDTLRPADPLLAKWLDKALEQLDMAPEDLAAFNEGLADGTIKFSVLDRTTLEAMERKGNLFSFERGMEVNSDPYPTGLGTMKTPLAHAEAYDPAVWPAATIMVRVATPKGDMYYVTNGCRRVHVFGSEPLNPNNKLLPVIVFDGPAAFKKVMLDCDVTKSLPHATPFTFATKDWTPPRVEQKPVTLRRVEDNIDTSRKLMQDAQQAGKVLDPGQTDYQVSTILKTLKEKIESKQLTTEQLDKLLKLSTGDLEGVARWLNDPNANPAHTDKFLNLSFKEMDSFLSFKRSDILPVFEKELIDGPGLVQLREFSQRNIPANGKIVKSLLNQMKDASPADCKLILQLLPKLETLRPSVLASVIDYLPKGRIQHLAELAGDPARLEEFGRRLDGLNSLPPADLTNRKADSERRRDELTDRAEKAPSNPEVARQLQDAILTSTIITGVYKGRVQAEVTRLKALDGQTGADGQVTTQGGFATQGLVTKWAKDFVTIKNGNTNPPRYILLEGRPGSGADHSHMDVLLVDTYTGRYKAIDIKQHDANLPGVVKLLHADPYDPSLPPDHGSPAWTAARKRLIESDMASVFSDLAKSPLNILTTPIPLETYLSSSNRGKVVDVIAAIDKLPPPLRKPSAEKFLGELQKQRQSVEKFVADLRAEAKRQGPAEAAQLRQYADEIEGRLLRRNGFFDRTINNVSGMTR